MKSKDQSTGDGRFASVLEPLQGGQKGVLQLVQVASQSKELPTNEGVQVGAARQGCSKRGYLNWEAV